ncbi:DinI-like family protein [Citrobacter freundii]|uniref:DinI-like family protein n=1 Tax=Citrobacter freundii TaxID=546 RepID=UPI000C15870D|nr:DinI-like family protein [Citrobacter freundii]PHZ02607.1 damage-inducible protein DinI [Citrobacter freundii]
MNIEISITKEKISKMPKGSVEVLKQEMTRRVTKRYGNAEVIVKSASNDGLSVMRSTDKEDAEAFVQETLQDARESTDNWFVR